MRVFAIGETKETEIVSRYETNTDILDTIARGWENFLARSTGMMHLRFIMQPVIVGLLAVRAGIRDARAGRPPFLWAAARDAAHRPRLLRSLFKDVRMPLLIGASLDALYQLIMHRSVYWLELLFTTAFLALVPYCVLRGLVTRVARRFGSPSSSPGGLSE